MKKIIRKISVTAGLTASLALAGCAKKSDSKTRDFPLGDGTFILKEVVYKGQTIKPKHSDTSFGLKVKWVSKSNFNITYVGQATANIDGTGNKTMYCKESFGTLQWQLNSDGELKEIAKGSGGTITGKEVASDCPVGIGDVFFAYKTLKVKSKDIKDGFHVDIVYKDPAGLYFKESILLVSNQKVTLKFQR